MQLFANETACKQIPNKRTRQAEDARQSFICWCGFAFWRVDEQKERLASPWTWFESCFIRLTVRSFLSLKCWAAVSCSRRCVVPVSLFRCVLFVLWFLSGDGCICHCHRLQRRRRRQQHCPLLHFINHVPNSIRSFIDITITNSEHAPSIPGMKTLSLIVLSKNVVGFVSSGAVYGEKSTCERARANPIYYFSALFLLLLLFSRQFVFAFCKWKWLFYCTSTHSIASTADGTAGTASTTPIDRFECEAENGKLEVNIELWRHNSDVYSP